MATRFVKATSKTRGTTSEAYDIDNPLPLFKILAELNSMTGQSMNDWDFTVFDYKGKELGPYSWKTETVSVPLGEIFS